MALAKNLQPLQQENPNGLLNTGVMPTPQAPTLGSPGGATVPGGATKTLPEQPMLGTPGGAMAPGGAAKTGLPGAQPVQPTQPTQPAGTATGNAALAQANQAAMQRLGRNLTPEEINVLKTQPGVANPDGSFNMEAALGLINKYSGDLKNPWGAPAGGGAAAAPNPQALANSALAQLLQGQTPTTQINENDPAIQAQRAAFGRINEQGRTRGRLAAAERGAARGTLGAGGFDAELSGIEQNAIDNELGFNADLLKGERAGALGRLMDALGLQQQGALTREGYNLQGQLGRGQLGLGYMNALLGNQQANNTLGFNYAALQNQMNNQALQAILQGL